MANNKVKFYKDENGNLVLEHCDGSKDIVEIDCGCDTEPTDPGESPDIPDTSATRCIVTRAAYDYMLAVVYKFINEVLAQPYNPFGNVVAVTRFLTTDIFEGEHPYGMTGNYSRWKAITDVFTVSDFENLQVDATENFPNPEFVSYLYCCVSAPYQLTAGMIECMANRFEQLSTGVLYAAIVRNIPLERIRNYIAARATNYDESDCNSLDCPETDNCKTWDLANGQQGWHIVAGAAPAGRWSDWQGDGFSRNIDAPNSDVRSEHLAISLGWSATTPITVTSIEITLNQPMATVAAKAGSFYRGQEQVTVGTPATFSQRQANANPAVYTIVPTDLNNITGITLGICSDHLFTSTGYPIQAGLKITKVKICYEAAVSPF